LRVLKARLHNDKLVDDFKELVLSKYCSMRSYLSLEVAIALNNHLADEGVEGYGRIEDQDQNSDTRSQHTHKKSEHKKIKPRQKRFLYVFAIKFFKHSYEVTDNQLSNFIMKELNITDPRSVDGWKTYLKSLKMIKKVPRQSKWSVDVPLWLYEKLEVVDVEEEL